MFSVFISETSLASSCNIAMRYDLGGFTKREIKKEMVEVEKQFSGKGLSIVSEKNAEYGIILNRIVIPASNTSDQGPFPIVRHDIEVVYGYKATIYHNGVEIRDIKRSPSLESVARITAELMNCSI
jgi:hypothetical protein